MSLIRSGLIQTKSGGYKLDEEVVLTMAQASRMLGITPAKLKELMSTLRVSVACHARGKNFIYKSHVIQMRRYLKENSEVVKTKGQTRKSKSASKVNLFVQFLNWLREVSHA